MRVDDSCTKVDDLLKVAKSETIFLGARYFNNLRDSQALYLRCPHSATC